MIGYILTIEQYNQVQGQYYSNFEVFNCVQDINGTWFLILSQQDKETILNTEWSWVLTLTEGDYVPPITPIPR
jgi:hypothetical protein